MDEAILMNYLRGTSSNEETKQVEDWYDESPENKKMLEQLYYTLFVGDRIEVMNAVDTEASLAKIKSIIEEKKQRVERKHLSMR